jgi:hypothetical protein
LVFLKFLRNLLNRLERAFCNLNGFNSFWWFSDIEPSSFVIETVGEFVVDAFFHINFPCVILGNFDFNLSIVLLNDSSDISVSFMLILDGTLNRVCFVWCKLTKFWVSWHLFNDYKFEIVYLKLIGNSYSFFLRAAKVNSG